MNTKPTQAQLIQAIEKTLLPGQQIVFLADEYTLTFKLSSRTNQPITPVQFLGEHTFWADIRMSAAYFDKGVLMGAFSIYKSQWT